MWGEFKLSFVARVSLSKFSVLVVVLASWIESESISFLSWLTYDELMSRPWRGPGGRHLKGDKTGVLTLLDGTPCRSTFCWPSFVCCLTEEPGSLQRPCFKCSYRRFKVRYVSSRMPSCRASCMTFTSQFSYFDLWPSQASFRTFIMYDLHICLNGCSQVILFSI